MITEQYSIGYEAGYQDGWDAALAEQPAEQEPVPKHCLKEIAAGRPPICARCNMGPCPHNTAAPQPAKPVGQEPRDARYALAMLVDPEKLEPWQLELYDKAMTAPQPAKREPLSIMAKSVIGVKHFGNPIPQAWYEAAKELERAHGIGEQP